MEMKQFHTLAVLLLVFPNFGLTQPQKRLYEKSLTLEAKNLVELPDELLDIGKAFTLIDTLCSQEVEGLDGFHPGTVSGAYNMDTGEFMEWNEYVETVGRDASPDYYLATGWWHTFWGTCSLKPESYWDEHSYTSLGSWGANTGLERGSRRSYIDVRFAGFTATTTTDSWRERCENVDEMAETFRAMPEVPEAEKTIWKGLDRRVEQTKTFLRFVGMKPGYRGRARATTKVRVVHAKVVFHIGEWYWNYNDEIYGSANTWQRMGGQWDNVYADLAYVEARGLVEQMPGDPNDPDRETCANMDTVNNQVELIKGKEIKQN
jgi:hypothetical protein